MPNEKPKPIVIGDVSEIVRLVETATASLPDVTHAVGEQNWFAARARLTGCIVLLDMARRHVDEGHMANS